jgi:hypothetical protein
MNIGVNSGDGNSIFDIANRFQKMQIRELNKNIETIKQKLRSGEDTGSTKFLDDMDKLNGLILQLRVKTGFIISENIDVKIEDYMDKTINENQETIDEITTELGLEETQTVALYNDRVKSFKGIDDIDDRLIHFIALRDYATEKFQITPPKKELTDYEFYNKILEELGNITKEYKSEITNTMSRDAFEKLNKVSDTIPNILSQISGLVLILSRLLKANFQTWSTEINNTDLSNLIDTSDENLTSYISMSNNDGIQPYKSIFDKNIKPLKDIDNFVSRMGEAAGVKSSDLNIKDQFKYINLMDYVNRGNVSNNYTPNFNYDVDDEDEDDLDQEDEGEETKFKQALRIKREIRKLAKQLERVSPKKVESLGVEETKGDDETTGAGKYYYPKRFL